MAWLAGIRGEFNLCLVLSLMYTEVRLHRQHLFLATISNKEFSSKQRCNWSQDYARHVYLCKNSFMQLLLTALPIDSNWEMRVTFVFIVNRHSRWTLKSAIEVNGFIFKTYICNPKEKRFRGTKLHVGSLVDLTRGMGNKGTWSFISRNFLD